MLHIKLKGMKSAATYKHTRFLTHTIGPLEWDQTSKHLFSESGHVAYQLMGTTLGQASDSMTALT